MTKRQKSLVRGISILGLSGLICKVIGVLYKIPLAHTIGPMGMGVYHQVFPTYNLLLTISSAGIPVAISRMVAGYLALDDKKSAKRVFTSALIVLTALGILGTLLMVLLSPILASAKGTASAQGSFLMLAPSLLFVCIMSAYRGFMQGRRRMEPTAISQLIEQVGKVAIAMPFAAIGMQRGGYVSGAAGALLGTSVAEFLALLYMLLDKRMADKEFASLPDAGQAAAPSGAIVRELMLISIPITIGASIVPIAAEVDSFMLVRLMSAYLPESEALISYGTYVGLVFPLINVPTALAMATSVNLVPAIGAAFQKKEYAIIQKEAGTGLRIASVIGLPASLGMSLLAEPILMLLFSGDQYTLAQLQKGARLLEISSLTIWLFTMVQATSGILQGLHKQRIPMYTLALGVVMKVLLNYTLVRLPAINIHGAPFASLLCYSVSLVPNLYYVAKYGKTRLSFSELVLRPGGATLAMALCVLGFKAALGSKLNHSILWLGLCILAAMAVFFAAALKLKAIHTEDIPRKLRRKKPHA